MEISYTSTTHSFQIAATTAHDPMMYVQKYCVVRAYATSTAYLSDAFCEI